MKKIINIIIVAVFLNFFMLSFGYGQQNGVGVVGIVPETDLNKNVRQLDVQTPENRPIFKENKYLYFFEKALGLSQETVTDSGMNIETRQTAYDQTASKLLLWGLLLIMAVLIWIILSIIDRFIFKQQKHYKHAHGL
ncbi:MAG: hypothetical protein NTZ49_03385 [Candidatus Parcubacteria bacterium]|nr:hypothetical protein [Candidatus Parcubacteria bacterium]